jgi:hypothetical protein
VTHVLQFYQVPHRPEWLLTYRLLPCRYVQYFTTLVLSDRQVSCTVEFVEKFEKLPAKTYKYVYANVCKKNAEYLRKLVSVNPRNTNRAKIRQTGTTNVQSSPLTERPYHPLPRNNCA